VPISSPAAESSDPTHAPNNTFGLLENNAPA
jgi:hypothetical protein